MIKVEPRITNSGLHRRQALYHSIESRGICVDTEKLEEARLYVEQEIKSNLDTASKQWGKRMYAGAEHKGEVKIREAIEKGLIPADRKKELVEIARQNEINVNSSQRFLSFLKDLGYKVPKITKKSDTGEWESKESAAELALRQLIRENQFGYSEGDKALIAVLNVRELTTLRNRYLNARLWETNDGHVYLSNYNAGSGTLTGRRNSKKHIFRLGGNAQNIPSHSESAGLFRNALVPRKGFIFLSVDQISAEDWPVNALAQNTRALDELKSGLDRHTKLASFIFGIPISGRTPEEWKESIERYLGKKTRHANNYGMKAPRMHDSLMQEGKYYPVKQCEVLLERANAADPQIQGTFHKYIQNEINTTRMLRTPFSRERQFLGFRPGQKNGNLLNEAYAWIPQSVVGDNTGFALEELQLAPEPGIFIVQEGHDSIVQEVSFDGTSCDTICTALDRTIEAFERPITFTNGITINIPVEAELATSFGRKVKIKTLDRAGIEAALAKLDC